MAADEEYLDNLLKSLEGNTEAQEVDLASLLTPFNTEKEVDSDETKEEQEAEIHPDTDNEIKDASDANMAAEEKEAGEEADWKADLDELLAAADREEPDAEKKEELKEEAEDKSDINELDVTQFIDGMDNVDDSLLEINDLLKKSDNKEAVDDDMLALLESIKDDKNDSLSENNNDAFDIFADLGEETAKLSENAEESEPEKKEKKKKRGFPWKRKKASQIEEGEAEDKNSKQEEDSSDWDTILPEKEELKEMPEKKEKEPGFFGRLFLLLTQEEEEENSIAEDTGENLSKPEAEGKEKTEKKKKKFKKGKKEGKEKPEGEEEENLEEKPEKKKKPKKEKKKKDKADKADKVKVKRNKLLNNKIIIVLTAFCATFIAAVVLLSILLPDYADKRNAREAFYQGNYKEAYILLYDKKLNAGDAIIFGRINAVLQLEKKWDTYEYYKKLNQEAEALDTLLQGVLKYEELGSSDEFGAEEEIRQIYEKIVSCLSEEYNIGVEEALEINSYDADTYTKKIYSVVYGTEFVRPGEEEEEPKAPQDILPEEEDIINRETENEGV